MSDGAGAAGEGREEAKEGLWYLVAGNVGWEARVYSVQEAWDWGYWGLDSGGTEEGVGEATG